MFQWLNENPGTAIVSLSLIVTVFGILITIYISKAPRSDSAFNAALSSKDATIENLRSQIERHEKEKAAYDTKQQAAEEHARIMDETISTLNRRISELESNQFFTRDENGDIALKNDA